MLILLLDLPRDPLGPRGPGGPGGPAKKVSETRWKEYTSLSTSSLTVIHTSGSANVDPPYLNWERSCLVRPSPLWVQAAQYLGETRRARSHLKPINLCMFTSSRDCSGAPGSGLGAAVFLAIQAHVWQKTQTLGSKMSQWNVSPGIPGFPGEPGVPGAPCVESPGMRGFFFL